MGRHSPEAVHVRYMEEMARAKCIREAAAMLVLCHTGTEFDEGVMDRVWGNMAAVAEEYHASPDDVQTALETYEPTLAIGPEAV